MRRKFLVLFLLALPLCAYAKQTQNISKSILGSWKIESIKPRGDKMFHPPKRPIEWTFTSDGTLIEQLGKTGAKIRWHYTVIGHDIRVSIEHMAFTWHIIGMDDQLMLVQHQLGLYRARHL